MHTYMCACAVLVCVRKLNGQTTAGAALSLQAFISNWEFLGRWLFAGGPSSALAAHHTQLLHVHILVCDQVFVIFHEGTKHKK